ncbi:flagellar hook assembly protein FlgD [Roseiconus lacunae]|uniref:Basal-body rod modification protein FlgD n=1 Tax=Roseiconus lacunae TaxID=2605694 RepID=A0ABT7PFQ0_9BACT|nr:flagellar hook capping FlgD N-terminal domain-containing protein [Roseiconus lacunae]MDM4015320.1 flagellar hook capping FlgD N-terminal domain-containing protein [Roseiconus lacunae]
MDGISSSTARTDYLQLLTVSLKNQDPMDPVDQEKMVNDLTQFSILEGIENLNSSFGQFMQMQQLSESVGMIGKSVEYTHPITGELQSGTVSELFTSGNEVRLMVDGATVGMDQITRISEVAA